MGSPRAVVVAALLVPAVALAQPSAKDKQKASELVKQAIAKSQAGDHESAVTLYDDAYKIIPQPLLLSNMGSEYQALAKPVEALRYYCKYLEADPNGSNSTFVIAQAKTLYIELGGTTTVEDGDVCKPLVKAEPVGPTHDEVTPPDKHDDKGKKDKDAPAAESKSSPLRWVGAGVAGVGAIAFTVGIVYGFKAKDISDQISTHDPSTPWPSNINTLESNGKSDEKKQILFMAAGGAVLVGGALLYFLAPHDKHESGASAGVSFAPVATLQSVGMVAAGRF